MTLQDLIDLDTQATLALNGSDSLFWDNFMYVITNSFSWSLVILALLWVIFKNNKMKDALIVAGFLVALILAGHLLCLGWIKPMVARLRPVQDPHLMYLIDTVRGYRPGGYSFFSGHSCNTMAFAVFLSLLFCYWRLTFTLFFWSITTSFSRIYLGAHFVGDVLTGWFVGMVLGFVLFLVFQRVEHWVGTGHKLISEQFTFSGYLKSDLDVLMSVILANYICLLIIAVSLGIG